MPLADSARSLLIVIDVQPTFLAPIVEAARLVARSRFMVDCARLLDIPVLGTVQNEEKMGPMHENLQGMRIVPKMAFSCCGEPMFMQALAAANRTQAILVGIETPICVMQTAFDLHRAGYEVYVVADATSARSEGAHEQSLSRLRHESVSVALSDSVVYEWMRTAEHPAFRDVLKLLKNLNG